jgi:hypothetical protein
MDGGLATLLIAIAVLLLAVAAGCSAVQPFTGSCGRAISSRYLLSVAGSDKKGSGEEDQLRARYRVGMDYDASSA